MPVVSAIVHGRDIPNSSPANKSAKYIFAICPDCSKVRWVRFRPTTANGISRCQSCCGKSQVNRKILPHGRGQQSPHWKGGRYIHRQGYICVWIAEDSPYYPMATHKRMGGGTIFEHRLVMAQSLGRCFTRQEHVHHINGDKQDNHLENLELISPSNHALYKSMCAHCELRKENRRLKREIVTLKTQLPQIF